jgi:hypothetical protein
LRTGSEQINRELIVLNPITTPKKENKLTKEYEDKVLEKIESISEHFNNMVCPGYLAK